MEVWKTWYFVDLASLKDISVRAGISKSTIRTRMLEAGVSFDRNSHIGAKQKGRPSPMRGIKLSAARCSAISQQHLGNKYCLGRIVSLETREKMRAIFTGRSRYPEGRAAEIDHQRQKFKRILKSLLRAAKIRKHQSTALALGYTRGQLINHISGLFRPGMSWADRSSFSIDHRVPVVEFVRRGIVDPKIVCSLANLQPLPPRENRQKSAKYDASKFDADLDEIMAFNKKATYSDGLTA